MRLVGVLLILGGLVTNLLGVQAQPSLNVEHGSPTLRSQAAVAISLPNYPLKEGIHLFGQAQSPGQFQTEYILFKMHHNRVMGAFFMPSSSFDCFFGTVEAKKLKVSVMATYEQQTYNHTVNLNQYHPIQDISNNDLRILDVCRVDAGNTALEY
ncbi:MAG: hypothetical protein HC790_11615 [Acaryochloridaceae cyanobacterium CSU_3_4]|nr:hypothetical protein [Acaryochloridaceae cyanobacterium CSU_3_4]